MSGVVDGAVGTVGFVASAPLAGDTTQIPRYAWSAEWMPAGSARPFVDMLWGYDEEGSASFAMAGAGLELPVLGREWIRLAIAPAALVGLGLPRNSFAPRQAAIDLALVAAPRLRISLGQWLSGASALVGVPVTVSWTAVPSSNFVESTSSRLGLGAGAEIGLALSL